MALLEPSLAPAFHPCHSIDSINSHIQLNLFGIMDNVLPLIQVVFPGWIAKCLTVSCMSFIWLKFSFMLSIYVDYSIHWWILQEYDVEERLVLGFWHIGLFDIIFFLFIYFFLIFGILRLFCIYICERHSIKSMLFITYDTFFIAVKFLNLIPYHFLKYFTYY